MDRAAVGRMAETHPRSTLIALTLRSGSDAITTEDDASICTIAVLGSGVTEGNTTMFRSVHTALVRLRVQDLWFMVCG